MAAYSGRCDVSVAGDQYSPAKAALFDDETGHWLGRITCDAIDWLVVQRRGTPIVIRLPDGRVGSATVDRFTFLLPAQATVTGFESPPW